MTLSQLKKLTSSWQKKLRLLDWDIAVRWMSREEENGEFAHANGYCIWSEQHKSAKIVISRNSEDIDHTVVHELLHVLLDGHLPIAKAHVRDVIPHEFAINALADALLNESAL
jgi:Zn-dependent peptidase ImmA (M78 family)